MTTEEEDRLKKVKRLLDSEAETHVEPAIEPKRGDAPNQEVTTQAGTPTRRTPTPPPPAIALDKDNMPLPRRVHEVDMEGTRVSPVAFESPSRPRNVQSRPVPPPDLPKSQPVSIDLNSVNWRRTWG